MATWRGQPVLWQGKLGDFWAKVDRSGGPDACWPWIGAIQRGGRGYGNVAHNGHTVLSHRRAWELTKGPIPDGLKCLHTCDNRCCCNPDHLFLGTQLDNMQDMVAKGRSVTCGAKGRPKPDYAKPRGERNSHARITNADVLRIRKLWADGQCTATQIAEQYSMSTTNARAIIQRKTWAHLSP